MALSTGTGIAETDGSTLLRTARRRSRYPHLASPIAMGEELTRSRVLGGQPAEGHGSGQAKSGLVAHAHVPPGGHVAHGVQPGNGMAAQVDHLAMAVRHQAHRTGAGGQQLNPEERRFGNDAQVRVLLARISGCPVRPRDVATVEIVVSAFLYKAVKTLDGAAKSVGVDLQHGC